MYNERNVSFARCPHETSFPDLLLIFFLALLSFGVGFILTLQAFEYHPSELTPLEIAAQRRRSRHPWRNHQQS
ncbi:MAG: hypothetical protein MZU97_17410 [Bacillus subtilis]|nr:hypothetical protein [Bacillus subtilis]